LPISIQNFSGGIDDHVHTVVSIPPKLAVSEFVQKIKGSGAFHINHHANQDDQTKFRMIFSY
jgi:REP element-mobilizing transposase RayT